MSYGIFCLCYLIIHEIVSRNLKQSEKWRENIHSAFKAVIEGESMKSDETCSNCGAPANVCCHQCGPYVFFLL